MPIVYQPRLFCTRWNGFPMAQGFVLQSKQLNRRGDKPGYAERAVTEGLVNTLIHRDYLVIVMAGRPRK